MRTRLVIAALGAACMSVHAGEIDRAGKTFAQRCASCHTVPDPKIRTDLAWLDQVNRTA